MAVGINLCRNPLPYVCENTIFVTYVTVNVCCRGMTHIKFATLSTLFFVERKTNTGLPVRDNFAREVSNNDVIGENFLSHML